MSLLPKLNLGLICPVRPMKPVPRIFLFCVKTLKQGTRDSSRFPPTLARLIPCRDETGMIEFRRWHGERSWAVLRRPRRRGCRRRSYRWRARGCNARAYGSQRVRGVPGGAVCGPRTEARAGRHRRPLFAQGLRWWCRRPPYGRATARNGEGRRSGPATQREHSAAQGHKSQLWPRAPTWDGPLAPKRTATSSPASRRGRSLAPGP